MKTTYLKNMLLTLLLLMSLTAAGCGIQTKEQYRADLAAGDQTNFLSIRCEALLNNPEGLTEELRKILPPDGVLLEETEVGLPEQSTVYDLLEKAAKAEGIVFTASGTGNSVYLSSIGGFSEGDGGALSGWMYLVNGEAPSVSCGAYPLKEGDKVEFLYTRDMGNDLGISPAEET